MPKVSVGLPVYNGERFIEEAINSILAQTFEDFELIISDNASTDRTEFICRGFASRDERVRYYRNSENFGAAWNFNRVVELSSGDYFKWVAHDDLCGAEFLAQCIEILERDIGVVLAYPRTMIIDEQLLELERYNSKLSFDSPSPAERFKNCLNNRKCYEVFGLIRRIVLSRTPLMGAYGHADGVLLTRLALQGRFYQIPEYLFFLRQHPEQSTHMWMDYRRYAVWYKPSLSSKKLFPYWRMYYEYYRSISMFSLNWAERMRCYRYLAHRVYTRRDQLKGDIAFHIDKRLPYAKVVYHGLKNILRSNS